MIRIALKALIGVGDKANEFEFSPSKILILSLLIGFTFITLITTLLVITRFTF